ncbi:hypothetical protein BaRGS_00016008 [Batillaria attramentaria]|uniref:Uncharacterized protein n=1 Tax=Batillaria attramentaria TaxID=370345 RepID=A0ABD0L099_9CAEN
MENIRQCLTIIATVALMQFQLSTCFEWSPSSPAEGTIIQACLVEKVSFPWAFSTAASETVINIEWHKVTETTDKMIATETGGFFFKTPVVPMTVGFLPDAGITLSNFTLNDLGTYRVTVNFKRSGSFFSQSRSAVLALPDAPIISGDRLVAHVQAEPVTDVITGERHIDLTCGTFLELGSRPVSVDWRLQEELLQLGEADDKIQSEVDDLRADVSSDVNDLQHKVSLREEADDTLASDLTDLQGKVSALEKRNTLEDKLASDVATLQEEQVQIKKKTSELEDLLKEVETKWTSAFEGLEENISKPVHRSCRAAGWIGFQASCYKLVKEKVSWSTAKVGGYHVDPTILKRV